MPNLNKVMLMGNLTRDPELRFTPSNTPVAKFSLAVNRRWRNQQGEQQEETCFVDCTSFGRQAEVLNQYLKKGRPVFVEGRLKLDRWQDKDGNNRSKLEVIVESFEFIDGGRGGDGGGDDSGDGGGRSNYGDSGGGGGSSRGGGNDRPSRSSQAPQQADGGHHPVDEDDIPF